jgi:glycerol uptake facilitator protein
MIPFMGELVGTALLILFGNGVVANVVLKDSKGNGGGWIVIAFGWAMAVFVGVFTSAASSGAHLNPAVTLALCIRGIFPWEDAPLYVLAQMLGAMLGAVLVYVTYKSQYDASTDPGGIQATFCTAPAIPHPFYNFLTEALGTFAFILAILYIPGADSSLGALDALPVALLVLAVGLSLGGPTGYAINPARDLGPRIVHFMLSNSVANGKSGWNDSGWKYSWTPVFGPLIGSALAAGAFMLLEA